MITTVTIPASHADLAECPRVAALTTLMPDGAPQTSVVWCDREGDDLRVNTMRGFQKERNMRRDGRVALLGYDPRDGLRYLEVRGIVAEMTDGEPALRHLDALTSKYAGRPISYFGGAVAIELAATEEPVLCRIRPTHVVALDARGDGDGCIGERLGGAVEDRPAATAAAVGSDPAGAPIPASHVDLLTRPVCGVLTTLLASGQPQSSLVWVDFDGECATVNTTLERSKGRCIAADPRVSLLVVDPDDTSRFIQVRGEVELVRDGAIEHLDQLTRRYTRHPNFYGHVYPTERRERETRVICRIHPRRVTLDAIHR